MTRILSAFLILLTYGCSGGGTEMIERFADEEDRALVESFLRNVQAGAFDEANGVLDPNVWNTIPDSTWRSFRDDLSGIDLDSISLVGASTNSMSGVRSGVFTYEGRGTNNWIRAAVSFEHLLITGFQIQRAEKSLRAQNAFTWKDKGIGYFLFLSIAAGLLLFSLGSAVVIWRSGMPKRKRWAFASLFGISGFSLNWATGATSTQMIYVGFPVAQAAQSGPFAPWIVTMTFPIGAILGLRKLKEHRETDSETLLDTEMLGEPAIASATETTSQKVTANDPPPPKK